MSNYNMFADLLQDHGLEQVVTVPTRLENTLDLICTNSPHLIPCVETMPGLSDHDVVYCEVAVSAPRPKQVQRHIPLYNKADWDSIRTALRDHQQEIVGETESLSTETLWSKFKDTLTRAVKKNIPHKVITGGGKASRLWITSNFKKLINQRDRAYRLMKKLACDDMRIKFYQLRRDVQRKTRRAYWKYINQTLTEDEEGKQSRKRFWTLIKHQRTAKVGVAPLKVNGRLVVDAKQKAETLNAQFHSVFSEGRTFTETEFQQKCGMSTGSYAELRDVTITTDGVKKLLQNLNPHKASGPDGISPRVLRELAEEVAPILTTIYQSSISTGEIPSDWKDALVTPIFKKGEHYDPANYRPVSLTSVPCKILEHIVVSTLMDHLEQNGILCPQQHGFRRKRSCETQLLELTEELSDNTERGKQTDIIVLDFAKAFDKVNHSLLIHKLHHYGVSQTGKINNWIKKTSFPADVKQW